jgi:hypothetical protein
LLAQVAGVVGRPETRDGPADRELAERTMRLSADFTVV